MLRQVLRELRFHPSRFFGTLLAIATSVAFMAGSSVLVATEQNSLERQQSLPIAAADIVITAGSEIEPDEIRHALATTEGVTAFEPSLVRGLSLRRATVSLLVNLIGLPSPELRWSQVEHGRWPQAPGEIVLTRGAAEALSLGLGDSLTAGYGADGYTVVGLTGEPSSLFLKTGYVAPEEFFRFGLDPAVGQGTWVARVADETSVGEVVDRLRARFQDEPELTVAAAAEVRAAAVRDLANEFDVFRYLLWAFAGIAAVVGMITIANTFTILLAQRRRQIGLLRAVGASGRQVRRRYLAESVALGVLGSAAGVALGIGLAAVGAGFTGSLYWGVALPWLDLGIALAAGVAITVLAAYLPVLRGTRVRPLEALQPEPTEERRRAGIWRAVICGTLVAAGLAISLTGLGTKTALEQAVAGSALIALGVLFGAVLFVPWLLAGLGAGFGRLGVTPRLAAQNAVRNPRRAAATATALMLAVGLIVTLQVGTATGREMVLEDIENGRPVDVSVSAWQPGTPLPDGLAADLAAIPGVAGTAELDLAIAEITGGGAEGQVSAIGFDPAVPAIAAGAPAALPDDVVLVADLAVTAPDGATVRLAGKDGTVELKLQRSRLVLSSQVMVSPAILERLGGITPDAVVWLSVPDRSAAAGVAGMVDELVDTDVYYASGAVLEAAAIESVLDLLLLVTTALLGVAVLIALIGVSNTLGLSVLERTRESALLRALGLQARSLRIMLLLEALALAVVGVGVGVLAGVFFGWVGAASMGAVLTDPVVELRVDLAQTAGMVGIAILAAALASVLPGRRAATASPTQALADI